MRSLTHAAPYFDKLKQHLDETQADLPCWHGEMYFEYHRGVFTSQGRNKRANRAAEFANLTAETAAARTNHFGKGTLRNELHFESAVNHGLGRNLGIEADMGCDELFNLLVVNELCNAVVILTHGAAGH